MTVASLSKTHAMTGWRCGWLVGPKALIQHAEMVALCMTYGLPGFIQEAALVAVQLRVQAEAATRAFCQARRDTFYAALQGVAKIKVVLPDAGMFMLLDVRATGISAGDFAIRLYEAEGVSVLDGAAFGEQTAHFVRVCYATDEAQLLEAAQRIRRFCASL